MKQLARALLLIVCSAFQGGCQSSAALGASHDGVAPAGPTTPAARPPSLIVLITIDQFRGDYLDRFGAQLHSGLARISRSGAWFTNAHHDHAITETAPGHATLLSGRFPRATGITANWVGVADDSAPLLGEPQEIGASPRRFQGTTLVDWLRAKHPRSRTLSVSMKDRGAILPVGRSRAEVYWYAPDGRFTTSRYYRDSLPDWVNQFNARKIPQNFAGKSWTLLLPDTAYHEPDAVSIEMAGQNFVFPHAMPADSAETASLIRVTPWMDEITLAFALDGLRALSLGTASRTDVLAISLSATDLIGHGYGPDSREMHDNVLRLDRSIGVFLDSLFKLRDSTQVAIVLTADHGIGTIPELAPKTMKPTPVRVDATALADGLRMLVAAANIDTSLVDLDRQIVLADRPALQSRRPALDSVLTLFALQLRTLPGIARVDRFQDLLRGDTINDAVTRRWVHQLPATSNTEMVITLTPLSIFAGLVATHGAPYDYDTHVPLIFYGTWFTPGRYSDFVRTVDLAPTLAQIAGVKPGERIDGLVLRRALK
ncbi:MAG TPA: alkaline phosphatase family protein [Gemmatimonadaceae bacterium]